MPELGQIDQSYCAYQAAELLTAGLTRELDYPAPIRTIQMRAMRDLPSPQCQPNQTYCTAGESLLTLCAGLYNNNTDRTGD